MSTTAPINGEILVGVSSSADDAPSRPKTAAEDAEFVTLADDRADTLVRTAVPAMSGSAGTDRETPDGLNLLRPQRRADGAWWPMAVRALGGAAFALALGLTFWISGGHALFAGPAQIIGKATPSTVQLIRAESRFAARATGPGVILINGTIANDGADAQGVPPVTVMVAASAGQSRRYVFGTQNRILNGGESMDFAYRVEAPAGGAKNVEITLGGER